MTGTAPNVQVTISPPLQGNYWSSGKTPQADWIDLTNPAIQPIVVFPVNGAGLEDLKIVQARDVYFVIVMKWCEGCWIKNVASIETPGVPTGEGCCGGRAQVGIIESMHNTIQDSYFYGTHSANTQSYGVEDDPAGFNLVQNNIFEQSSPPLSPARFLAASTPTTT